MVDDVFYGLLLFVGVVECCFVAVDVVGDVFCEVFGVAEYPVELAVACSRGVCLFFNLPQNVLKVVRHGL